jgi:competence protein ComGF
MQIHLADGSAFLRMHKPSQFGDNLEELRPMVKEIDRSHKMVFGYETGKYGTDLRILEPIFDKNATFLGSLELGLNPDFMLKKLEEIANFSGMIFIQNEKLKLFSKQSDVVIQGYKLQSAISPKVKDIYKEFLKYNKLEGKIKFEVNGHKYLTYIFEIYDFQNKPQAKILFFEDITNDGTRRNTLLFVLLTLLLVVSILLLWIIYHLISRYEKKVKSIYQTQMTKQKELQKQLEVEALYLEATFENNPNIIITTDGKHIDKGNL